MGIVTLLPKIYNWYTLARPQLQNKTITPLCDYYVALEDRRWRAYLKCHWLWFSSNGFDTVWCIAGNSWGSADGQQGIGIGQQEQFYGCSDVKIVPSCQSWDPNCRNQLGQVPPTQVRFTKSNLNSVSFIVGKQIIFTWSPSDFLWNK